MSVSTFFGGRIGYDGLIVIKPDGKLYIQSGIGNHGTESGSDVAPRGLPNSSAFLGRRCELTWGNTSKNLPWTCPSGGSQTTHGMTRAALRGRTGCQGEAAADCGEGPGRQARGL